VESLGGTFIAVMDEEFRTHSRRRLRQGNVQGISGQAGRTHRRDHQETGFVITTALIPDAKRPCCVSEEMVKTMKPGSVIVDLAANRAATAHYQSQSGDQGLWRDHHGHTNLPVGSPSTRQAFMPQPVQLRQLFVDRRRGRQSQLEDEIIKGSGLTRDGQSSTPP